MSKKTKPRMEYRYYDISAGSPILALLGEKWNQNYGKGIDCLHFHNYLEIGYCYNGEGVLTIRETDYPFQGGMFSIIPKNVPHTTNSLEDTYSQWEYLFIDSDRFLTETFAKNVIQQKELIKRIDSSSYFFHCEEMPRAAGLIRQIMDTMRERREFFMEETKGLLFALLIEIARISSSVEKKTFCSNGNFKGGGRNNYSQCSGFYQYKLLQAAACGRDCRRMSHQRNALSTVIF